MLNNKNVVMILLSNQFSDYSRLLQQAEAEIQSLFLRDYRRQFEMKIPKFLSVFCEEDREIFQ